MNLIYLGIGLCACRYLPEAFLQGTNEQVHQNEPTGSSYRHIAIALLAATTCAYAVKKIIDLYRQSIRDTPELFWRELEKSQRPPPPPGPVTVNGHRIAESLDSLQEKMFFSCTGASQLFFEYLTRKKITPENVIDLGCGVGANSIPLLQQGVTVTAIDRMQCLLDQYESRSRTIQNATVSLQCHDLTTLEKYGDGEAAADVVLAIDVLSYLPSTTWKSTMEKIVRSLKPEGYFFGTVFVKNAWFNSAVVAVHEQFGCQYYPIRNLAERLILHSGLEMVECRLRENSCGCYEFVARKPSGK